MNNGLIIHSLGLRKAIDSKDLSRRAEVNAIQQLARNVRVMTSVEFAEFQARTQ